MESTLEVYDIQEREDIAAPSFPTPPTPSATSFPAPKKRVSAFKKQRQSQSAPVPTPAKTPVQYGPERPEVAEKRSIDEENKAVLDSMSPEEIAQAQQELFSDLNPSFIQRLLRRANLDDGKPDSSAFDGPSSEPPPPAESTPSTQQARPPKPPKVTVEDVADDDAPPAATTTTTTATKPAASPKSPPKSSISEKKPKKTVAFDEDAAPPSPPANLIPTSSLPTLPSEEVHFPHPPKIPDLDPADPDFLETMHKKFFPNLPADPSKLAWMAPLPTPNSTADRESPYYPGQDSLPISALRFDFRGQLLPPKTSRKIPVTKGLHHHGEAPEAAGYTIPELARLARSAVAAQRCLAYQTLGRMLYRLGRGDWGQGVGGRGGDEDDLAFGLWRCFQEGRVLESLEEEVSKPEGTGHLSCRTYATEALWLFEKGGWKEKWRGM
ncbi:RPAP1-like protein [Cladorrhinum samala]|uniref:RPAP1-like protein n=1 Tax=Cladorrhinum samala TaxID=585594 RepID=A0AAV9HRH2_9PEZI|nr:RPAP1-like protein [Cladorrhinum samala]